MMKPNYDHQRLDELNTKFQSFLTQSFLTKIFASVLNSWEINKDIFMIIYFVIYFVISRLL